VTPAGRRRFPIRYSVQRWNDALWFYGSLVVVMSVLTAVQLISRKEATSFILVLVFSAAILVTFWIMRLTSYLETGDDTLRVRYVLRHVELPYTALSRVRRQPLEVAFQPAERRRFVNRFVRRLAREPAAYIRLDRRQPDLVAQTERRLGPRLVAGADIVVPIVGVDEFVAEMKSRLRGQPGE
jgi:hypothetical protein